MKKTAVTLVLAAIGFMSFSASAHEGHDKPDQHLVFKGGIHAHLNWEAGPKPASEGILKIEFRNAADHKPMDIKATPNVVLWMPSMGHGSSPTAIQRVVDANGKVVTGAYRASKIYFIMAGPWDVRLVLKNNDGTEETQSFPVVIEDTDGGNGGGHHH